MGGAVNFTKSVETSDLKLFGTLEAAQAHELTLLFGILHDDTAAFGVNDIALKILENKDKVIDILTTTERSRPQRRKINGATRKKKEKKPLPETPPLA